MAAKESEGERVVPRNVGQSGKGVKDTLGRETGAEREREAEGRAERNEELYESESISWAAIRRRRAVSRGKLVMAARCEGCRRSPRGESRGRSRQ